jgi:hypothetical protein
VQGAVPEQDTIDKAQKEGIPILISTMSEFEVVGKIYNLLHPEQG